MKLESQVTSLEISKRLKELGVKQESYFVWMNIRNGDIELWDKTMLSDYSTSVQVEVASAFTVAELGEMLPEGVRTWKYSDEKDEIKWAGQIPQYDDTFGSYETEVNGRGKMLVYLLENKLI
jgi:hypothetical protein